MMNRSFVLVAVLGLCSISFAAPTAPAAGLQGIIETIPFPTTVAAIVPDVSASSSLSATATAVAGVPEVAPAPAPVVVHGGAPETGSVIEGLRGSAGGVFRRGAPSSSDVIDALRASGSSSGTFARDDVEARDPSPHGNMGAGAPDLSGIVGKLFDFGHRRRDAATVSTRDLSGSTPTVPFYEAVHVNVDAPDAPLALKGLRAGKSHYNRQLDSVCSRLNARDCRRQESGDGNFPGAPDFDPILSQLREGATFFRRSEGQASQISSSQASPTNFPGAPEFDPILSQLRQGATVFRRSKEARQENPANFGGAPDFDGAISRLRQGTTIFRRSPVETPRDENNQLASRVSDENLHGLPELDSVLSGLRQGTGVFRRSEGEDVTISRRQDSGKNLPGAPEFDPILDQLRHGDVFSRAVEEGSVERREPSPFVSPGNNAPSAGDSDNASFADRRDEVESRNFGGQAIPVDKSNPDFLKALWKTSQ